MSLRAAFLVLAGGLAMLGCQAQSTDVSPGDRWLRDVQRLAADDFEGRRPGTEGYRRAAQYVVREFNRLGLRPPGTNGYLQPVPLESRSLVEAKSKLELRRGGTVIPLEIGRDVIPFPVGTSAQTLDAPLVFAGYGLTIDGEHDDFAGLDVRGKVVVVLIGNPRGTSSIATAHYASVEERLQNLERRGAAGILVLNNPRLEEIPWERLAATRALLTQYLDLADSGLKTYRARLAAQVNPARSATVLGVSDARFAEILALDAGGQPLPQFEIDGTLRATIVYEQSSFISDNVVAVLPGSDPALRGEYVLLSAHLDHLGIGEPIDGDAVYNGALDNASGVATLLELARLLTEAGAAPRRSVLFLACTAEETGLLGSKYFAGRSPVPLPTIVANLNFDIIGAIVPLRSVIGFGARESDLQRHLETTAREMAIPLQDDPEPERNILIRSDNYSFIKQGVPSLSLSIGRPPGSPESATAFEYIRSRYHAPSDDTHRAFNLETAARFNQLAYRFARSVANSDRRPQWAADSFFGRLAAFNLLRAGGTGAP